MKVGSIIYATEQGLGHLARSFYDAGIVTDVLVLQHNSRATHMEWYPERAELIGVKQLGDRLVKVFLESMDCVLFFETPFDWGLLKYCRDIGTLTAIMPMYECHPVRQPYSPDLYICPSKLDLDYFPTSCGYVRPHGRPSVYIPVPVDGSRWRLRTKAKVFIHNAGHGGLRGRNGTGQITEAIKYIRSPAQVIMRSQSYSPLPYEQLYQEGDVFVFPDKFNGLSLPLQEARAAGMLVMASNRYPANTWLPNEPLISVAGYSKARVSAGCLEFDEAIIDPKTIASTIDTWYDTDITAYSLAGREWALANSWEALRPRYLEVLEELCDR